MAEENDSNAGKEEQGATKSKKMIIVGVAVLILALGGTVLWKTGLAKKFIGEDRKGKQESSSVSGEGAKEMGPTFGLGSFIVNLNDPTGRRYLKVKAELELTDKKVAAVVEKRLPQLRDSIILLLSSKSFEEIASMEGKMRLRQEMLDQLNIHLGKGKLNAIYFTEFVIQ